MSLTPFRSTAIQEQPWIERDSKVLKDLFLLMDETCPLEEIALLYNNHLNAHHYPLDSILKKLKGMEMSHYLSQSENVDLFGKNFMKEETKKPVQTVLEPWESNEVQYMYQLISTVFRDTRFGVNNRLAEIIQRHSRAYPHRSGTEMNQMLRLLICRQPIPWHASDIAKIKQFYDNKKHWSTSQLVYLLEKVFPYQNKHAINELLEQIIVNQYLEF
jgi:hypothetical protein